MDRPADVWLLTREGCVLPAQRSVLEKHSDLLKEALSQDAEDRVWHERLQLQIPQLTCEHVVQLLKAACSTNLVVHVASLPVPTLKALAEAASLLQCPAVLESIDCRLAEMPVWCKEAKSRGTIPEYSQALDISSWAQELGLTRFQGVCSAFVCANLRKVAVHSSSATAFLPALVQADRALSSLQASMSMIDHGTRFTTAQSVGLSSAKHHLSVVRPIFEA